MAHMRSNILGYVGVFVLLSAFAAWGAQAAKLDAYTSSGNVIVVDLPHGPGHSVVVNAGMGLIKGKHGDSLEDILASLGVVRHGHTLIVSTGSASSVLGGLIGKPISPIKIGLPGVSPIPEPRTWALYGFGAVLAAWAVRKQLRSTPTA